MSEAKSAANERLCIVGMGGSAGSLQPMMDFFETMAPDSGLAFVIVYHADESANSQLDDILSRHTQMPVRTAEDGTKLEADSIYLVRGHTHATIEDDTLRTSAAEQKGAFDVIDFFFRSLAEAGGERAIGILLSGSGSDGAQGLREIRALGGLTIAQDPDEADWDSMPLAAIRTGFVDRVLPVARMAEVILEYVKHSAIAAPEYTDDGRLDDESASAVEALITFLHRQHDIDFRSYKRSTLTRRIQRRMGICHVENIRDYHSLLKRNSEEVQQLAQDMLVGVTSFFRDPEAFEDLREHVIEPLIQSKGPDDVVRVWVPGASTGEEAYSIAMLIQDVMREQGKNLPVKIFASDVDPDAVQVARAGKYAEGISTSVPDEYLKRFFDKQDHFYMVGEQLREDVLFTTHNILHDPPFSQLDLISCRNVLIYIKPEAQETVFRIFAFALRTEGYLFLGTSDATPGPDDLFKRTEADARILRRTQKKQPILDLPTRARVRGVPSVRTRGVASGRLARINRDVLLDHFTAAMVLTNEAGEVLHFFGPTSKYLQHPTGEATLNILGMTEEPVATRIRLAVREVLEENERQQLQGATPGASESDPVTRITIVPVAGSEEESRMLAFIFESAPERHDTIPETEAAGSAGEASRVQKLETDLAATREDLQTTIRELQRTNEDLVGANEEIMSMNEELQSANEELQTSTEELQSVNEELTTVNQELNEKIDQVTQANADLENLLKAADIMAVFLADDLTIRRFSPAATRLLNLITTDVGRPLSHISHNLQDLDLPPKVEHVIDTGERIEEEVQDSEGNWYIMRIHPYATDRRVEGAVVNFSNVTQVKAAERLAERRSDKLRELARQITEAEQAERHRIAGLVHDEIQQMLAGAIMKVNTVLSHIDEGPARDTGMEAVGLLAEAVRTARSLTSQLSPPVLRDAGFMSALNWLAAESRRIHGLQVDVQMDNRTEPASQALALFLIEATRELLFNVAKHADTEHASLRLSRDTDRVCIEVTDNGSGFDTDQLDSTPGKLGFGLVGIMRRAELLGGGLQLEGSPGNGCRATLWLPADIFDRPSSEQDGLTTYRQQSRRMEGSDSMLRVLLVDDHEIMRDGLAQMLESAPGLAIVGTAQDGEEAIEMASGLSPDVILMDIGMEPMNGIEATRIVKEQHPEIRIVGLSVHEEGELSREMREAGASAFVTKGAAVENLVAAIRGDGEK